MVTVNLYWSMTLSVWELKATRALHTGEFSGVSFRSIYMAYSRPLHTSFFISIRLSNAWFQYIWGMVYEISLISQYMVGSNPCFKMKSLQVHSKITLKVLQEEAQDRVITWCIEEEVWKKTIKDEEPPCENLKSGAFNCGFRMKYPMNSLVIAEKSLLTWWCSCMTSLSNSSIFSIARFNCTFKALISN